jgi:hypothetical protein
MLCDAVETFASERDEVEPSRFATGGELENMAGGSALRSPGQMTCSRFS